MPDNWKNKLFFGDNLTILREHVQRESVDLIYLDPPFNSAANYNVLFKEQSGAQSAAQITAFEDTWHWGPEAEAAFHNLRDYAPEDLLNLMTAMRGFLNESDMMAYLTMMAPRLVELHRVLKETGSIYLHCDPTASHYIKLLMDAVFGPKRFLNEVSWKRSSAHSDTKQGMQRYGKIRDVLLVYTKSAEHIWNPIHTPYTKDYLESEYRHVSSEGRYYKETDLTAAKPGGETEYAWNVKRLLKEGARWEADLDEDYKTPQANWEYKEVRPYNGRFWAYSKDNLIQFANEKKLIHRKTGMPRLMQFADDMPGIPLQDLWDDIPPASGSQDLGYPTQKPEALLERIISASSNEGDLVLDPFCGCGTTVNVAERLRRRWVGVDVTHLAIGLIKNRLHDTFQEQLAPYEVIGVPVDVKSAEALAIDGLKGRYDFQYWAIDLVGGRPAQDKKKGKDSGIDGLIYFHDDHSGTPKKLVIQVKSGNVKPGDIRELKGVMEREQAPIGAFLTLKPATRDMKTEATAAGFYEPADRFYAGERFPRLQILTIEELLHGAQLNFPDLHLGTATHKRAARRGKQQQSGFDF